MTSLPPRIGITTDASYSIAEYERALRGAGALPVPLLAGDPRDVAVLDDIDGIVFAGGEDVDPARYGAVAHPKTESPIPQRDAFEIALARAAFERDLPVLAICRGVQVSNVAFGGSLVQHVPDVFGREIPHQPQVDGTTYRGLIDAHRVRIDVPSRLADLVGRSIVTGSRHHQALDRIASGFHVVARTSDGVAEALEPDATMRFWIGVQWHPESTVALDHGVSAALFAALVAAARSR